MSRTVPKYAFKYMLAVFLALSAYSCAVVNESIVYEPEPPDSSTGTLASQTGSESQTAKTVSEKSAVKQTVKSEVSKTARRSVKHSGKQEVFQVENNVKTDKVKTETAGSGIKDLSAFQSEEEGSTVAEVEIKKAVPEKTAEEPGVEEMADEDCGCSKGSVANKSFRKGSTDSTIKDRMDAFGSMLLPSVFTESEDRPSEDDVVDPADEKFYSKYSKKWGIYFKGTENKGLISAIAEWFGTPHKMGGCSKYGVDCSCFVKNIYKEVYGINLNRSSSGIYYNDLIPVKKEELKEGDIVCFKIRGRRISHIGIYLKNNKFVHSSRSKGVTISDLNQQYFKRRYFSGGRVLERGMNASKELPSKRKTTSSR
jgi:murein DD-endopeptidase / murein LD-carboxypeptidase